MTVIGWFSDAANHTSSLFRASFAAFAFVSLLFNNFPLKCISTLSPYSDHYKTLVYKLSVGSTVFRENSRLVSWCLNGLVGLHLVLRY